MLVFIIVLHILFQYVYLVKYKISIHVSIIMFVSKILMFTKQLPQKGKYWMNTKVNAENNKYDAKIFVGLNFFNMWQIIFLLDIFLECIRYKNL